VPEPGTLGLMGAGVAGLAFARARRRKSSAAQQTQPEDTPQDAAEAKETDQSGAY